MEKPSIGVQLLREMQMHRQELRQIRRAANIFTFLTLGPIIFVCGIVVLVSIIGNMS